MPTQYDPKTHHRRSIRLQGFDYAQEGGYFVTICSQGGRFLLGEIVDLQVRLNACGRAVEESWEWLARQYPHVSLDEFVVMPNHLHGIIVISDDDCRGGSRAAPTEAAPTEAAPTTTPRKRKPLGRLIGAFKTVSTQAVNDIRGTPGEKVWQRNYFERVIRNKDELDRIRKYVVENPAKWAVDRENPFCRKEEPAEPWEK